MNQKISLFIIFVLLLTGCRWKFWEKEEAEQETDQTFSAEMPVIVSPAVRDTLTIYVYANGTVYAGSKAEILAETSGKALEINVGENQKVEKGDVLLRIDVREQQLELQKLQIEKSKAENELIAWKKIENGVTDEQLRIRTGLEEIEISMEKLQLQINKATVKAPFSGTITNLQAEAGEFINAGKSLADLYDLQKVYVDVQILESEIMRVEVGQKACVQVPGRNDVIYKGRVESIAPYIEQNSRSCRVRVKIDNDGLLKEGMFAEVKIGVENYKDKILVVKDALLMRDGKKLIFTAQDGKAIWQYVQTGMENNHLLEITEGVEPGQLVIVDGHFSLSHDANIEVKEEVPYNKFSTRF